MTETIENKITSPDEAGLGKLIKRRMTVLRFLLGVSGVIRNPIILLTIMSSLSRAAMIFAINETARQAGAGIGWSVALLVASAVAMLWLGFQTRIRSHRLIVDIKAKIRQRMSRNLTRANIDFLLSNSHGKVFSSITGEVDELSGAVINIIESIEALLIVCIAVPYLFWISPSAGFATIVAMMIGTTGYLLFDRPARKQMILASKARAEFCNRVTDMLAGWKEIRLRDTRRTALEEETRQVIDKIGVTAIKSERLYSMSSTFGSAAIVMLLCFVVIVVPNMPGGSIAVMFQILTIIFLTSGPIEQLFGALPRMSRAENAYYRIQVVEEELARSQSLVQHDEIQPMTSFQSIELRSVVARVSEKDKSDDEAFVLGPVSMAFEPGETVFICGGNGSGKTTLLGLITGLRNPDSGDVLIDGKPLTPEDRAGFRELFTGVFSGFHLFDRTFGMTDEETDLLRNRIQELKLADRVSLHEDRFSTLSLSAGQRRRLALAVALAELRPIIVLDEFAADQDPANRAYFYDVLLPELAASGQLVIAVTHDDHQFGKCDRLIKMEAGQVVSDVRQNRQSAPAAT